MYIVLILILPMEIIIIGLIWNSVLTGALFQNGQNYFHILLKVLDNFLLCCGSYIKVSYVKVLYDLSTHKTNLRPKTTKHSREDWGFILYYQFYLAPVRSCWWLNAQMLEKLLKDKEDIKMLSNEYTKPKKKKTCIKKGLVVSCYLIYLLWFMLI